MSSTTVTNSSTSSNPDYQVKKTNNGDGDIQHVQLHDTVNNAPAQWYPDGAGASAQGVVLFDATNQIIFDTSNPFPIVPIERAMATVGDGRLTVTTAGTAEQFPTRDCLRVDITALDTNTGVVVIGGSTVIAASGTRRGTPLVAGQPYSIVVDNLDRLYMDSTVSGEGVTYTYYGL